MEITQIQKEWFRGAGNAFTVEGKNEDGFSSS